MTLALTAVKTERKCTLIEIKKVCFDISWLAFVIIFKYVNFSEKAICTMLSVKYMAADSYVSANEDYWTFRRDVNIISGFRTVAIYSLELDKEHYSYLIKQFEHYLHTIDLNNTVTDLK